MVAIFGRSMSCVCRPSQAFCLHFFTIPGPCDQEPGQRFVIRYQHHQESSGTHTGDRRRIDTIGYASNRSAKPPSAGGTGQSKCRRRCWDSGNAADVKDAQALMRHLRASTTLHIYQQFVPESRGRRRKLALVRPLNNKGAITPENSFPINGRKSSPFPRRSSENWLRIGRAPDPRIGWMRRESSRQSSRVSLPESSAPLAP
jgi:hypothetical protein